MFRSLAVTCAAILATFASADEGCEPQRVVSPPVTHTTGFGGSAATNGRFWFVSDAQARIGCCTTGAVYVYEDIEGRLVHTQTLVPHDAASFDMFGTWLDADGDRLVVGSYNTGWPTTTGRGGGFVYEFDGDEWVETARLVPPLLFRGIGWGTFVVLDGDTVVVSPIFTLQKHIYTRGIDGWEMSQTIEAPDGLPSSASFGAITALKDNWLFASAVRDSSLIRDGGSVYVFRRDADGEFEFTQKILPPEPYIDNREFGDWIAFDGRTLAISARRVEREFEFQGAVFIYELEGDQWVMRQELNHSNPEEGDELGHRMALTGDLLLARTNRNGSDPGHDGTVLRFERDADGRWHEVGQLVPNPFSYAGFYGVSIATDGQHTLVGAPEDHAGGTSWPGAAYFFDLTCGDCEADLDADGTLTIFDFLTFLNLFQDGDATADFDGDGELTLFDFLAFQTAFDAGCE
ncbi:MAG: hypothetical protein NCW75_03325 [Phycisphaera sp.]|nr:MAG: hypothetical protein NCW75_03325 [Phycisphaera sp.]